MPDEDPCRYLKGSHAYDYCKNPPNKTPNEGICDRMGPAGDYCVGPDGQPRGMTRGARGQVEQLATDLTNQLRKLLGPGETWAPKRPTDAVYAPFLWLGQHLAVSVFFCVVVVCGLTAWQGAPRLRQMGQSTGWTLAAVVAMVSIPGAVALLNSAIAKAFSMAFASDDMTLLGAITADMKAAGAETNPLGQLVLLAALVVALALALLVFLCRNIGILAFVCLAPLVLASLARGGDVTALKTWFNRLLGLMFAPMALLLIAPFVALAKGSLILDAVLLVAADLVMMRMIVHGVPYVGPRLAGAVRALAERHTDNRAALALVRVGVPRMYEQETARTPRTVPTPGRAVGQDAGALFAAFGGTPRQQGVRLTTASAIQQAKDNAERRAKVLDARRQAHARHTPPRPPAARTTPPHTPGTAAGPTAPGPRPGTPPTPTPTGPPTPPGAGPRPAPGTPPSGPTTP
ncbi:hypothetical protein ABT160_33015 [Streptomyces sp. NPDC001941]|uniref:hypothetical protein n=1 Tax=Streptomyces sp. NPDC001941 TaxID=3154659 RepID=UPI00332A96A2